MIESDDESVNSRSSMASNAFSAVHSLAEELMANADDVQLDDSRSVDLPTMPEKTQLRRNRSVASASSVGPDIVDEKHQKRRSSFDPAALGDLLVGKRWKRRLFTVASARKIFMLPCFCGTPASLQERTRRTNPRKDTAKTRTIISVDT